MLSEMWNIQHSVDVWNVILNNNKINWMLKLIL
jgi:hypothetical protein